MERRQGERRSVGRRVTDRPDEPRAAGLGRRWGLLFVAGGLAVALLWPVVTRFLGSRTVVPAELIGTWKTTTQGYEERALEFTRNSVLLHSDDYHFTVHPIRRVRRERHDLYVTYRIEYQDVDAVTPLVLRFISGAQPLIRLEHTGSVWRREPLR